MKTCAIIPTYNEAKTIAMIVREVRRFGLEVLVVDDGSNDNTSRCAQESGARVIRNDANEGKGTSLIKGFSYCLKEGFDAVVTMDGDGQHLPSDIPTFTRTAANSQAEIFIGNRMYKTRSMPRLRLVTNKIMSWAISALTKQKIPDTQCGFRLIKRNLLEQLKLTSRKYEIESEILIRASQLGFKIESVPVETIYSGEKSQINPYTDTIRFIKFICREMQSRDTK